MMTNTVLLAVGLFVNSISIILVGKGLLLLNRAHTNSSKNMRRDLHETRMEVLALQERVRSLSRVYDKD